MQVIGGPQAGEAGPDDRDIGLGVAGQRIARRERAGHRVMPERQLPVPISGRHAATSWQAARPRPASGMLGAMTADESASGVVPPPRNPADPYRICMVCLGNICRSPMAEVVLREKLGRPGSTARSSSTARAWATGTWTSRCTRRPGRSSPSTACDATGHARVRSSSPGCLATTCAGHGPAQPRGAAAAGRWPARARRPDPADAVVRPRVSAGCRGARSVRGQAGGFRPRLPAGDGRRRGCSRGSSPGCSDVPARW